MIKQLLISLFLLLLCLSCGKSEPSPLEYAELEYGQIISPLPIQDPIVKPLSVLPPIPLDKDETDYLDLRAVGDAGWARNGYSVEKTSLYFQKLYDFDPQRKILIGDINFMNWESTLGKGCLKRKSSIINGAYSFISHPDSLKDALRFGFNLLNMTNNHSRDCYRYHYKQEVDMHNSERKTLHYLRQLSRSNKFTWHGMGLNYKERFQPRVITIQKGKQTIKIAFNALYAHYHKTTQSLYCQAFSNCFEHSQKIMQALKNADADIRILSIHSQGQLGYKRLSSLSKKFIERFDGDIVLGHGAHKLMPVRAVKKPGSKKYGVIFEDFGNFLHPGVKGHENNLMGRVLIDMAKKEIVQVQVITIKGMQGEKVDGSIFASSREATTVPSNLVWKNVSSDPIHQDGSGNPLKHAYSNL